MISVSVVIPTHNRAGLLHRTLDSLGRQQLPPSEYEVIVVADGCSDDTMQLLRNWNGPYSLIPLEQTPGKGAAAARNKGAATASADLLVFLDDDMEASPQLLSEHLRYHREKPGHVVLGHFPMQPPDPADDLFTKSARIWWAEEFARRAERGYRYTFRDLCTGNVSLAKSLFMKAGGFDEAIAWGAGEDYEFGYRLIQHGSRFRYLPTAASIHHTMQPLHVNLRRAEQEGYGQALLVQRHPELFWSFNISVLSRLTDRIALRPVWAALWKWPALAAIPGTLLRGTVGIIAHAGMYSLAWRWHRPLRGYYYWRGVRTALGSPAAWERLAQDAPLEPPGASEIDIDIDIVRDLPQLDNIFDAGGVNAVRIWSDGEPVGRIAPWAGAEPLTAEHMRNLLVQRFPGLLPGAITRGQLERGMPVFGPRPGTGVNSRAVIV